MIFGIYIFKDHPENRIILGENRIIIEDCEDDLQAQSGRVNIV
jgi:hypothetical protein